MLVVTIVVGRGVAGGVISASVQPLTTTAPPPPRLARARSRGGGMTIIGREVPMPKSSNFGILCHVRVVVDSLPLVPFATVYRTPEALSILGRPLANSARY